MPKVRLIKIPIEGAGHCITYVLPELAWSVPSTPFNPMPFSRSVFHFPCRQGVPGTVAPDIPDPSNPVLEDLCQLALELSSPSGQLPPLNRTQAIPQNVAGSGEAGGGEIRVFCLNHKVLPWRPTQGKACRKRGNLYIAIGEHSQNDTRPGVFGSPYHEPGDLPDLERCGLVHYRSGSGGYGKAILRVSSLLRMGLPCGVLSKQSNRFTMGAVLLSNST